MLKGIRNNLRTKNLQHCLNYERDPFNDIDALASWDDVSGMYGYDRSGVIRLLPIITDEHIDPTRKKIKVSLDAEVFSNTFAKVMLFCSERNQLPRDFSGTASILSFFNDLFDSLNGRFKFKSGLKGPVTKNSPHFKFWEYAKLMLPKMKFLHKVTNVRDNRSPTIKNFISTVMGFEYIAKKVMEKDIKAIAFRRINQDALESFNGSIRSYSFPNTRPNITQFSSSFLALIINNLNSKHSIQIVKRINLSPF